MTMDSLNFTSQHAHIESAGGRASLKKISVAPLPQSIAHLKAV
jgi:hypothetical protein